MGHQQPLHNLRIMAHTLYLLAIVVAAGDRAVDGWLRTREGGQQKV